MEALRVPQFASTLRIPFRPLLLGAKSTSHYQRTVIHVDPCYWTAPGINLWAQIIRIRMRYSSVIRDCKTGATGSLAYVGNMCLQWAVHGGCDFGPIGETFWRIWVEWPDINQLCIQIYRRFCSQSVNLAIQFSLWLALIAAYVFTSKISYTQENYRKWMWLVNIVGGQRDKQTWRYW